MLKELFLCAGLLIVPAASHSEGVPPIETADQASTTLLSQTIRIPGTAFDIVIDAAAVERGPARITSELLTAIVQWLSRNYDLPPIFEPPAIEFVSVAAMAAFRHEDLPS
jgi:hypothetical protein